MQGEFEETPFLETVQKLDPRVLSIFRDLSHRPPHPYAAAHMGFVCRFGLRPVKSHRKLSQTP